MYLFTTETLVFISVKKTVHWTCHNETMKTASGIMFSLVAVCTLQLCHAHTTHFLIITSCLLNS